MNDPRDPQRRKLLQAMGSIGVGAAAGGWLPGLARTALAAAGPAAGPLAASLPANAIDVHGHFFNATDASVVGYLTHSTSHGKPRLERFLELIGPVLRKMTRFAPTAAEELLQLQRSDFGKSGLDDAARVEARRDAIAEALAREMRDAGLVEEFGAAGGKGLPEVPLTAAEIRALLDPDSPDGDEETLVGLGWDPAIRRYFRFLGCMFQERWMNLRAFRMAYEPRGIHAVFGALVDFNHWYSDTATSTPGEQIKLHSLLARRSNGYMLPLVAYSPWSDICSKGAILDAVVDAISHQGFIGAKIYPPVGFLPAGNKPPQPDGWPSAGQLEAHLGELFSQCARLGAPVMAHANATMGRDFENDGNSGPQGWIDLVAKLAAKHQAPLVNLGHFGGDGTDLDANGMPNDWTARFSEIMEAEGGEGFYGDLGYWSGLRHCPAQPKCIAIERLDAARDEHPGMANRVMYGSDWFMMIKERDWKDWPGDIASSLAAGGYDRERIFHANAMACFGLGPGGRNRDRLQEFLGSLPAWMA